MFSEEKRKEILARPIPAPRTPQEIEAKLIELMNGEIRWSKEHPNPSMWEQRQHEERANIQVGLCFALGYSQLDYIERQLARQEESFAKREQNESR